MRLQDKVIFITGGAKGIGGASAKTCAGYGGKIIAVDFNEARVRQTVDEINAAGGDAIWAVADVRKRDQVKAAIQKGMDKYGRIDCLYNAAGVDRICGFLDMSDDEYDFNMDINVKGTFICCVEVARVMIPNKKGRIINTSSIAAIREEAFNGTYCMSKAAVAMMTRVLALELAPYHITTVAIQPGNIETDILRESFTNRGKAEGKDVSEFYAEMEATIPMGYIGHPEEIAELVAFLCDDRSAYIDGNSILIAGGKIMA
ncbi:MAG: SDR family NAD(P)-dependent oxidoreductase [Eubacteriales bacterium]|nr:SDR family NAD(P)-dependent oxidoreductase [Eubacteriales bacterium]